MRLVDEQRRGGGESVADSWQVGRHDIGCWKVIAAEPVNLGELAISLTLPGAEVTAEDDAHKLDRPPVRVPAYLGFRVTEHGDNAVEGDLAAELLKAFSTSALRERLPGFEPATR